MLFGMSLINSFTHIQENWKFVIICVQNQCGVVHPWHGTVANLWGRHKDFTEFNENFEQSYLFNGLSNIVTFFTVWFLKIFCIKWIHIFFWVQCYFKENTLYSTEAMMHAVRAGSRPKSGPYAPGIVAMGTALLSNSAMDRPKNVQVWAVCMQRISFLQHIGLKRDKVIWHSNFIRMKMTGKKYIFEPRSQTSVNDKKF